MSKGKTPFENRVALIAGPTASGKTAVAVKLAQALESNKQRAVIINADSAQVYADLAVVSARPTEAEMGGIEHRLFGEWDGAEACSAAGWAKRAKAEIDELHAEGIVPILVGGTGMYMKVLFEGIAPIPEIDPEVRAAVRALPTKAALDALMIEDPERAIELDPGDSQRIARALEVKRSTGTKLADWQLAKVGGIDGEVDLHAFVLLPDRDWLYERCDRRFEKMLHDGAIAEVEDLLARKLDPDLPVMRAIGVPEIAAYLGKEKKRDAMIEAGSQATRNYAKRQYTWFRRQPPDHWAKISETPESINSDLKTYFASLLRD
ncbi:MAG: tRNA (adenosine(37)-N6)-dimethylallyltransferase MiaA [Pseudomonadota bacterium]